MNQEASPPIGQGPAAVRPSATGRTLAEKILSAHAGTQARAGDIVVCKADLILGTDGSTPMAIEYFEAMGGDWKIEHARYIYRQLDDRDKYLELRSRKMV